MAVIEIAKAPSDADIHTWADYAELLALINRDRLCTQESFADRVREVKETSEEPGPATNDHEDENEGEEPQSGRPSTARGVSEKRLNDYFQHLAWRERDFGEAYPFKISDDLHRLQLRPNLSNQQKLYVLLLVSANLRFYGSDQNRLTNLFEVVALYAFRGLMPVGAEAHLFGAATSARYTGSKFQKFSALCVDIRGKMLFGETDFRQQDSGDGGIDLVGWLQLNDTEGHIPIAFGQCACSRDNWTKKQLEASHAALDNTFSTGALRMNYMFVPQCFRSTGGSWAVASSVQKVVFLDRLRLIRRLGVALPFDEIGATQVLAEILEFTEELV